MPFPTPKYESGDSAAYEILRRLTGNFAGFAARPPSQLEAEATIEEQRQTINKLIVTVNSLSRRLDGEG